ncbi:enolase C-terminal domain-like protein, partial [Rhizobium johnstonii]
LTGDYVPWVNPQAYRELTTSTSTPIHTGDQIYLRHNFKELIETQAVRVIGPDPSDIGGIAELKWVASQHILEPHQIVLLDRASELDRIG